MKKFLILLYPILAIALWAFAWVTGNNAPVPSLHAFAFLIHSSGWWYIPVLIATVVFLFITTVGTIESWFAVMYQRWIWFISLILIVASIVSMTHTRGSAGDDPNVKFRYNQYRIEKGWDK